jgi:kynureninase
MNLFSQSKREKVIYFWVTLWAYSQRTKAYVDEEVMDDWANLAVEGHFYAEKPWWDYHERFAKPLGKIGALSFK